MNTVTQITVIIGFTGTVLSILWFLFKIYTKIELNSSLTKVNLKATSTMLNYFIENKMGNGEFKEIRQQINDTLLSKEVK